MSGCSRCREPARSPPKPRRKDPEALGKEPSPGPLESSFGFLNQQAAHHWLNLVVFLFLSGRKYRQRTENDSFPSWSLGAKLVLFLASALVLSFQRTQCPARCRQRWAGSQDFLPRPWHWLSERNSHQALCGRDRRGWFHHIETHFWP